MLKKTLSLLVILALLLGALPALAADTVSASTPLSDASENKLNNLRLAAQAIDGVRVPHGDSFSFNDTVGPREKGRGYRTAPNGRGAMVTGGGVAQAASTLYLALLKLGKDVRIDPFKTYGSRFEEDYVQDPAYAVITDYDADLDFSFTNLGQDLSIDMWVGDDDVWCVITVGKSAGFSFLGDEDDEDDDDDDDAPAGSVYQGLLSGLSAAASANDDADLPAKPAGGGSEYRDLLSGLLSSDDDDEEDDRGGWFISGAPEGDDEDDEDEEEGSITGHFSAGNAAQEPVPLCQARLNCGGNSDVLHNVELAADCVNDTVLESGDTFSFNDVVGPRTKKYGYRRAINGRGSKVTGGGVAQVATVLWLAIKGEDDFAVVEKSTYGKRYNQHYVKSSSDAILTDYSSDRDFIFRYTGDESVTIYTYVSDGWLNCDIYEN